MCTGAYLRGSHDGSIEQKVADQARIDKVNRDISAQKDEASALYKKKAEEALALAAERDKLKTDLEAQDATNRKSTENLRGQLASLRLRFRATQGGGSGNGSGSAASGAPDASGTTATPIVQIPDKIAVDLRRLAFDADQLNDSYKLCYGYVQQVSKVCK